MRPTFGAGYTGVTADVEQPRPNTEDRSLGELATDVAIDVAGKPLVDALRTGAQAWRTAETTPEAMEPLGLNTKPGWGTAVEKGLGHVEDWLTSKRSDRARALDTVSLAPGPDERSFFREPIAATIHQALPSVGYGAAAWATGGSSLLAQVGTTALMGVTGMGESLNELRDFTDKTPTQELNKLPLFQDLMRRYQGDEQAARDQMYKDLLDPKSQIFNFFVNAANFPAFKHGLRTPGVSKAVGDRLKAAGYGMAEGMVLGAGETGTEAYIDQLAKVRTGEQQAIDTGEIAGGIMRGLPFGAPMAVFHGLAPPHYDRAKPGATAIDTSETATAAKQINPQGGPTPTPGTMTDQEIEQTAQDMIGKLGGVQQAPAEQPQPEQPQPEQQVAGARPTIQDYDMVRQNPEAYAQGITPNVADAHTIFKTAKGSEYFMFGDGTTVRNKAPRREHGNDMGWKDRSQRTVFMTPEHANELGSLFQAEQYLGGERINRRVYVSPRGMAGVQYMNGVSANAVERRTYQRLLPGPQVGAIPVELWRDGTIAHFGNPITEVHRKPETAGPPGQQPPEQPVEEEGEQYGPLPEPFGPPISERERIARSPEGTAQELFERAGEQPGPQLRPPRLQGRMTWSNDEQGFSVPVRVLERPAQFENGQWMQDVAYTNPRTGRTEVMQAPVDELQEQAGPSGRPGEPPPVQTPERPLPPQFPEMEEPEYPGTRVPRPEEFGEEGFDSEARARDAAKEKAGLLEAVRAALALMPDRIRARVAVNMENKLRAGESLDVYDLPERTRDDFTQGEYRMVSQAMELYPREVIEIVKRDRSNLQENPVLRDLQARHARDERIKKSEQDEETRLAALQKQFEEMTRGTDGPERQVEAALEQAIRVFRNSPRTQTPWRWRVLRSRAAAVDQARQRAGWAPVNWVDALGDMPYSRAARQQAAQVAEREMRERGRREVAKRQLREEHADRAKVAAAEAMERLKKPTQVAAKRAELGPEDSTRATPRGWYDMAATDQKVHEDVAAFTKLANSTRGLRGVRIAKLLGDRPALAARVETYNKRAEQRGWDTLTLPEVKPHETTEQKQQAAWDDAIEKLQKFAERGELATIQTSGKGESERRVANREAQALVNRLERIQQSRAGEIYTAPVRTVSDRLRRSTRKQRLPTITAEDYQKRIRNYGRKERVEPAFTITGTKEPFAIPQQLHDQLGRAGLLKTGAEHRAESAAFREAQSAMRAAADAEINRRLKQITGPALRPTLKLPGRALETGERGSESKLKKETVATRLKRRAAAQYQQTRAGLTEHPAVGPLRGARAGGREIGPLDWRNWYSQNVDKAIWNRLSTEEQTRLKQEARVRAQRGFEDIIRAMVTLREREAAERVKQGKPPVQLGARGKPMQRIPTAEQAIEEFRTGQESLRQQEAQAVATGGLGKGGTRGNQFAQRERVIKNTMLDAIKKRFGSDQRFNNLLNALAPMTEKEQAALRYPRLSRTEQRRIRDLLEDVSVHGETESQERGRQLLKVHEDKVKAWRKNMAEQIEKAGQLETALGHMIERTEKALADAQNKLPGGGSITWTLAKRIWNEKRKRFTFRTGKEDPAAAYYNFMNDIQKMREDLRIMRAALTGVTEPLAQGKSITPARQFIQVNKLRRQRGMAPLTREQFDRMAPARAGQAAVLRQVQPRPTMPGKQGVAGPGMSTDISEINRYTGQMLGDRMREFVYFLKSAMAGDTTPISDARKQRVEQFGAQYKGVSLEAAGLEGERQRRELTDLQPDFTGRFQEDEAERPGSAYATQDVARTEGVPVNISAREFDRYTFGSGAPIREIGGGRYQAEHEGVNIVESRMLNEAQKAIDAYNKRLEKQGVDVEQREKEQRALLEKEFPLRTTSPELLKRAKRGVLGMGPTREQSVADRVAHLPAPAEGMTRLYRVSYAAPSTMQSTLPDWMAGHTDHMGRWFASDPTTLDWYVNHIKNNYGAEAPTRVTYIDVPTGRADKLRVDNHDNSAELRKYSRVPEEEYFVSKDIADRARPVDVRTMAAPTSRVKWQTLHRRARSSLSGGKDIEVATNPDMATIRQIIDGSASQSATVIRDPETRTTWAADREDVMHAELMDALRMRGKEAQLEFREFSMIDGRIIETDVPRFGRRGERPIDEFDTTDEQRQARMMRTPREISRWLEQDHADMGYTEKGLPADRIGPKTGPLTAEEQRYVDASNELYGDGEPAHELVMPVETAADALERVSNMLAKDQLPGVAREYVNDRFLQKLAVIAGNSKVYHAPYDAVSGLSNTAPAFYKFGDGRIVLSHDVSPELYARSVLHETGHAALFRLYETDDAFAAEINHLFSGALLKLEHEGYTQSNLPQKYWGMTNPHEFMSEIISNQGFRDWLDTIGTRRPVITGVRSILNAIYRAIRDAFRRVMGAKDGDTALDVLFYDQSTVLGDADKIIKRNLTRLAEEGPITYGARSPNGVVTMGLTEGARAFRDGLNGMFGRAGFQLQQTLTENRGFGMQWRTMYDISKVGSPEFNKMTKDLFELLELKEGKGSRIRDADKREIAEMVRIWTGWNSEGRKMAGKFIIDEGMHTAWADAPIGERAESYREDGELKPGKRIGKNAHIQATRHEDGSYTADHLRDEQVAQQHAAMEKRLADTNAALPPIAAVGKSKGHGGFKEFRDRVYKFTTRRAEEVRRNDIRSVWAVSDLVPDSVTGKKRDALLDALERWTDPERKLSPADQKALDDAGLSLKRAGPVRDKMMGVREMILDAKEFRRIVGPYSPFTRHGDVALSGTFNIKKPDAALVLEEDMNEATGKPATDARYIFPTEDDARDMVRDVTKEYQIAQLDGGTIWIDTKTGQRPRVPDGRTEKGRVATEKEVYKLIDDGNEGIEQYHWVQFQPKLLLMEPDFYTANENMKAFQQEYGDKLSITKPKDVYRHDGRQNEHYTTTQMQKIINFVRATGTFQRMSESEQAGITRQFNLASEKFVMARGFQQRQMPRNYVMGPTTHVLASLDDYSRTSANHLALSEYGSLINDKSKEIKQYLKDHEYEQGDRNFLAQERAYNALMRRLHNPTRNPHDTFVSRAIDRGMRVTMLDKLPTVRYFAINGTETALIGGPLMVGRHSVLKVAGKIAKYYRTSGTFTRFRKAAQNDVMEAFRRGTNMTNFVDLFTDAIDKSKGKVKFADGLKDLLQRAANRNIFDVNAGLEYQSAFPTSRKGIDVALDYGQGVFQALNTAIENNNRFVTLGAAYELEMERLLAVAANPKMREHIEGERRYTDEQRHKAASDYAIDIAHQANGVYANYNAPEIFTREGPLGMFGPMIFQFKKWPQRITMIYLRSGLAMMKGVFGDWVHGRRMSPENREGARQFVAMIAMVGLAAGALGLPTEPFSIATNLAFMAGISRYNWDDAEAGFRQWLAKHGGKELSQFVAHGPLSYITGLDVAGSLSQSDMLAFGSPASNKVRDLQASLINLVGGAMLSTLSEFTQGIQSGAEAVRAYNRGADDVAWKKAGESARHLVPIRFVSDAMQSFMGASGTELASGRVLGQPYTPYERVARALGFTPTRESEAREARSTITSFEKREAADRKRWSDLFASSPPGAQREAVWQRIQREYNPYHPGNELTQGDLLKAANSRQKAQAESRNLLGIPQNRNTRALMPMAEAYGYR